MGACAVPPPEHASRAGWVFGLEVETHREYGDGWHAAEAGDDHQRWQQRCRHSSII